MVMKIITLIKEKGQVVACPFQYLIYLIRGKVATCLYVLQMSLADIAFLSTDKDK